MQRYTGGACTQGAHINLKYIVDSGSVQMNTLSNVNLRRTDSTLDHSQKAEKVCETCISMSIRNVAELSSRSSPGRSSPGKSSPDRSSPADRARKIRSSPADLWPSSVKGRKRNAGSESPADLWPSIKEEERVKREVKSMLSSGY